MKDFIYQLRIKNIVEEVIMLDHHFFKKKLCYFTVLISLVFFNYIFILKSEGKNVENNKKNKESILNTFLLKTASFLPLNPYLLEKGNSVCKEDSKGIPIQIQSKNITLVFKRDGSLQCGEKKGIPVKIMQKELQMMGVDVFKAAKGHLGSGRSLSSCGTPTNNINIFYISSKKIDQVLGRGFYSCIEDKK